MTLILSNEGEDGITALSTSRETDLKLKIYQDVYHQITGKLEKTSARCSKDLIIDFDEISQIHHKIMQMCDVHHIIAKNETITVLHSKERKEQFTSFERFKVYNASISSPTMNIIMEYNFSILTVGSSSPQQYKVIIKLNSRLAILKQMQDDTPPFFHIRFHGLMFINVAEISVEYADYVIARGFIDAFNEWTDGCKKNNHAMKFIQKMQRISYLAPGGMTFLFRFFVGYSAYNSYESVLSVDNTATTMGEFFIIFFTAFMLISMLARFIGGAIENSIDSYVPLSYLMINKGDERLLDECNSKNKISLIRFIFTIIGTVSLGIISSKIANMF